MKRIAFFAYGLICYLMFLGVFAYLAGFLSNVLVPKSINSGVAGPIFAAVAINVGLLVLFGLQHSVMARPSFKAIWTRIIPKPIERATYVLATNIVLVALFFFWQPLDLVLWDLGHPAARAALWTLFAAGWGLVFVSTLLLNHFDLFGLRQVWLHLLWRPYTHLKFKTPLFYKWVRHPLYVGWMTAFWATPTMTLGHLLFAAMMTGYMLIAIRLEERNLVQFHGRAYADYRRRVPMLIPRLLRRRPHDQLEAPATA
jgi:protein-S-isoprenylcysteine O-methyltransferase Ste14